MSAHPRRPGKAKDLTEEVNKEREPTGILKVLWVRQQTSNFFAFPVGRVLVWLPAFVTGALVNHWRQPNEITDGAGFAFPNDSQHHKPRSIETKRSVQERRRVTRCAMEPEMSIFTCGLKEHFCAACCIDPKQEKKQDSKSSFPKVAWAITAFVTSPPLLDGHISWLCH